MLLLLLLTLLLVACTPSLQPLYSDRELIFDSALLGVWRDANEPKNYLVVTRGDDGKSYRLLQSDSGGTAPFTGRLLKLGGLRFIDLYPAETSFPTGFYGGHIVRTHTFGHIDLSGDHMKVHLLDPDWFKTDQAKESPVKPIFVGDDDQPLLTQPTAALQAFAIKYAQTAAFGGDSEWTREANSPNNPH